MFFADSLNLVDSYSIVVILLLLCLNIVVYFQTAKRDVRKFANKMVTSKEAWREVQSMKANDDMMRGNNQKHNPTII